MNAEWALVVVTLCLVGITMWYAIDTHHLVHLSVKQFKEARRPILAINLEPFLGNAVKLRIQNVGAGAAFGIAGTVESRLNSGTALITWSYPVLGVEKYEEFGIPVAPGSHVFGFDEVRTKVKTIVTKFKYKSESGDEYLLNNELDIEKLAVDWVQSAMLVTGDRPDRIMPRIANAIEKLTTTK